MIGIAGKGTDADALVKVELCPFTVTPLATGGSFASVSAAGGHVLVSGNPSAGAADRAFRLVDKQLVPLAGIGQEPAYLPVINAKGMVAFYRGRQADGPDHTIQLLDGVDDVTSEKVVQVADLTTSLKWDGDRLVYLRLPGVTVDPRRGEEVEASLSTIWPRDQANDRKIKVKWPAGVVIGSGGRVAVARSVARGTPEAWVVDQQGAAVPLPNGWYPLAFEPDGDRLAVANVDAKIGLVSPPAYAAVQVLGASSDVGRVWYGDWTSAE